MSFLWYVKFISPQWVLIFLDQIICGIPLGIPWSGWSWIDHPYGELDRVIDFLMVIKSGRRYLYFSHESLRLRYLLYLFICQLSDWIVLEMFQNFFLWSNNIMFILCSFIFKSVPQSGYLLLCLILKYLTGLSDMWGMFCLIYLKVWITGAVVCWLFINVL